MISSRLLVCATLLAAGLAGGLIFDQVKRGEAASYNAGYQAGARRQPPNPLQ